MNVGLVLNTHMARKWGMEFDEQQLRRLLQQSTLRSKFYQVIREELKRIGRWKNRPRGNSAR